MNTHEIIADHLTHLLTQHGYQPNTTHRVNHTRIALCPGNHDHTNPFDKRPPTLPVCPHNCPHIHVIHIGQPEHTTIRLVTGSREYGWKAITTQDFTHPESLDQFEQELLTHLQNDPEYKRNKNAYAIYARPKGSPLITTPHTPYDTIRADNPTQALQKWRTYHNNEGLSLAFRELPAPPRPTARPNQNSPQEDPEKAQRG